jgi:hypothetical protein
VCRDEASNHFENRIRELQTSVEWTGVANGLRPTHARKTRREPSALQPTKQGRLPSLPDPLARVTSRKGKSRTAPMGWAAGLSHPKRVWEEANPETTTRNTRRPKLPRSRGLARARCEIDTMKGVELHLGFEGQPSESPHTARCRAAVLDGW